MGLDTVKATFLGTHRARVFDDTLRRVVPFLDRAGITRIANVTGLDTLGVPTFMVTRPNARSLSVSQGKGLTMDAARVSGIMEAIEHHHAETAALPLRLCRIEELPDFAFVHDLNALPAQPKPLFPSSRLLWAPAVDLCSRTERWVPYELVHLDMTLPLPESSGHFLMSSSGLASGNTTEEATVHALLELVERDAITLFRLGDPTRREKRKVDLGTVDDEGCRLLIDRIRQAGFLLAIWDITTDVDLATFCAGLLDGRDDPFRRLPVAYGFGCHLDRSVALIRAITEAAQSRLTNIAGARDDTTPEMLDVGRSDERQVAYRRELSGGRPQRDFRSAPHTFFERFGEDLEFILSRLGAVGLPEALLVDLSKPEWPVSVVRAIVPGLEPFHELPGYQPGARGRRILGVES